MKINEDNFSIDSIGEKAVDNAKEYAIRRLVEQQKTKRLLIITTATLIIVAALIMAFGPVERQTSNMIIGIILLVFALGSIGASQFVIKAGGWEVSTATKDSQIDTSSHDSVKDSHEHSHDRPEMSR